MGPGRGNNMYVVAEQINDINTGKTTLGLLVKDAIMGAMR